MFFFLNYVEYRPPIQLVDCPLREGWMLARRQARHAGLEIIGILLSYEEYDRARRDDNDWGFSIPDRVDATYREHPFHVCECPDLEAHRHIFQRWHQRKAMEALTRLRMTHPELFRELPPSPFIEGHHPEWTHYPDWDLRAGGEAIMDRARRDYAKATEPEKPQRSPSKLHPLVQLDEELRSLGME